MYQALDTATNVPTSRKPKILLAGAIGAGPLFLLSGLVQGATRDGFDFTRHALSQLSLGDLGWIQIGTFVATGALATAGAFGYHRAIVSGPGTVWVPRLIGIFGVAFLLAAVFTADPGAGFPVGSPETAVLSPHGSVHMLSATIGFLALCGAFLVLGRYFTARNERGWALACRLAPIPVVAGSFAASVTVMAFTAGAGFGLLFLAAVSTKMLIATSE